MLNRRWNSNEPSNLSVRERAYGRWEEMMWKRLSGRNWALLACSVLWIFGAATADAQCGSNQDCDTEEYCMKADGDCIGTGTCEILPPACPLNIDPVCGCDGLTYNNSCMANQAGTSIAFDGECPPPPCQVTSDCGFGEYCVKDLGSCQSIGFCQDAPLDCPLLIVPEPKCGCDGLDYDSECWANLALTTVAYDGTCQPACQNDGDCGFLEYCDTAHNGCGMPGACRIKPDICAPILEPVCGCDETSYDNACFAAQMAVSVVGAGVCGLCPFDTGTNCIFTDGLESAGTARWSSTIGD